MWYDLFSPVVRSLLVRYHSGTKSPEFIITTTTNTTTTTTIIIIIIMVCFLFNFTGGVNIDATDKHGITPLILAAVTNQAAVMALLLAAGADPDISAM